MTVTQFNISLVYSLESTACVLLNSHNLINTLDQLNQECKQKLFAWSNDSLSVPPCVHTQSVFTHSTRLGWAVVGRETICEHKLASNVLSPWSTRRVQSHSLMSGRVDIGTRGVICRQFALATWIDSLVATVVTDVSETYLCTHISKCTAYLQIFYKIIMQEPTVSKCTSVITYTICEACRDMNTAFHHTANICIFAWYDNVLSTENTHFM
jgi:hypothetical protein